MRIVGLFLSMLVVFWVTSVWLTAFGVYWHWRDVEFALSFTLFFGTIVAVPVIVYLICADLVAGQLRFPLSTLAYLALVALGLVLFAAYKHYWQGHPLPTSSEGWYYYWRGYIPLLTTACVPLLWRLVRRVVAPN